MGAPFLIDVPPPTISGSGLHIGHCFSYSQMDFIARYQKYLGNDLLYPFCFDCNGIPTEKLANKQNIRSQKDIIAFAEDRSKEYKDHFEIQKMDWSKETFHSFDDNAIKLANLSFNDLKAKNLVYKAKRKFFWCPATKVSVSQSEIDDNGCYERSGIKVEEKEGEGWFIDILNHLPRIREAINQIEWHPPMFKDRLHSWLDGLNQDWSISREREFGIPIPGEPGLVFDTWFTSSLSPQMAWATKTKETKLECPVFDARFQAHDIIRTWALFTIIKSLYHNNQIPWKHIIISGHASDIKGNKLSKSAGNATPIAHYFNEATHYGVRYWAAQNQIGTDTKIDPKVMLQGKKLANKIRNAYRFLALNKEKDGINESYENIWNSIKNEIHSSLDKFEYPNALQSLTKFFWQTFCDIYIKDCKKNQCYESLRKILTEVIDLYEIFLPGIKGECS